MLTLLQRRLDLHGDRATGDGKSVQTGLAWVGAHRLAFLASEGERLSATEARQCRRVLGIAEEIGVPVLLFGTLPWIYHRAPTEDDESVDAIVGLFEAVVRSPYPILALVQKDADADAEAQSLLPFDVVVHPTGVVCTHPACVPIAEEGEHARRQAVETALRLVQDSDRQTVSARRSERLDILAEQHP